MFDRPLFKHRHDPFEALPVPVERGKPPLAKFSRVTQPIYARKFFQVRAYFPSPLFLPRNIR